MDRAKSNKSTEISLCEKSMLVVANIIRLSSLSIAQRTPGTTPTGKAGKELSGPHDYSHVAPKKEPVVLHDQFPARRLPPTYVMPKPAGNNQSTSHEPKSVDESASDYIRKMRKKFGCGL